MIRLLHLPADQLFRRTFATETVVLSSLSATPIPVEKIDSNIQQPLLQAELRKELPGFPLQIQLTVGVHPVGLLGASGAGKSITLRMIAGIVRPTAGSIVLNGRTLYCSARGIHLPASQRRIGVVFQDYELFPHRSVAQNVGYALHNMPRAERDKRVMELLRTLAIAHLADRLPGQISGGERQRTAIARCLAMRPEALLFDEPFAALDPHLRRSTEEQLRLTLRAFRGPVLFVTHDMEEAFRFCQQLAVLDHGRMIASGPRQALFENPGTVTAARLTGCKNVAACVNEPATSSLRVPDWQCDLKLAGDADPCAAIGYRSHHFRFQAEAQGENVFLCWLVETSEAPHEMTLYLRLHAEPSSADSASCAAHIQADVPKLQWQSLSAQPQPWRIQLVPERILCLCEAPQGSCTN